MIFVELYVAIQDLASKNSIVKLMVVHFVCSGNSFRSRLAEAYLKSLKIPGIKVMSSGANTNLDKHDRITSYGALVLAREGLDLYASPDKVQLTQERLDESDLVVCMNRDVYRSCLDEALELPKRTYIWNINDVKRFTDSELEQLNDNRVPKVVQTIYEDIREHVDGLVAFLKRTHLKELVDVLDEKGAPIGKTSDIETIHENGWWHTGAHIGLYTLSGKVLLERRSRNIIFNSGLWDLTMGGVVAAGETPEAAILRELHEELDITLKINDLIKLFVGRYDHYLPRYGFHNRNFTHTYIARIQENIKLNLQTSEVAEAKFVSLQEALVANTSNNVSRLDMIPTHVYYRRILDAINAKLSG